MDNSRYQLQPGVWLDARRALWIESQRLLAVADLHLGYPWVQRARGQLLPLPPDDSAQRLRALQKAYNPETFVVVGDVVHAAIPSPALGQILRDVLRPISANGSRLVLIVGNHDRGLASLLRQLEIPALVRDVFEAGQHLFMHGDIGPGATALHRKLEPDETVVIGHEHPAIHIGDQVATSVKCPCFLVSGNVIVLPAFSAWAAGAVYGAYPLMSDLARAARFTRAVAVIGRRLLPVPLQR